MSTTQLKAFQLSFLQFDKKIHNFSISTTSPFLTEELKVSFLKLKLSSFGKVSDLELRFFFCQIVGCKVKKEQPCSTINNSVFKTVI